MDEYAYVSGPPNVDAPITHEEQRDIEERQRMTDPTRAAALLAQNLDSLSTKSKRNYQLRRMHFIESALHQAYTAGRAAGLREAADFVQQAQGKYGDIPVRNVRQLLKQLQQASTGGGAAIRGE